MSRLTQGSCRRFPVRGCHPLWPAVPDASGTKPQDHWPRPLSLATTRGVSGPACAGPVLMSFPPATEMFQFAGFASQAYRFSRGYRSRGGLPHSEIPGSPIARISPGLVAACHVLHRLSVPRHPPDALLSARSRDVGCGRHRPRHTSRTTAAHRGKPQFAGPAPINRGSPDQPCLPAAAASSMKTLPRTAPQAGSPPHRGAVRLGHIHKFASPVQSAPPRTPGARRGTTPARFTKPPEPTSLLRMPSSATQGSPPAPTRAAGISRKPTIPKPGLACSRESAGCGGERDRTDDLLLAKQALSQLSYTPLFRSQQPRASSPKPRSRSRTILSPGSWFLIAGGPGRI